MSIIFLFTSFSISLSEMLFLNPQITSEIRLPKSLKSFSVSPLVVAAEEPNLIPEVIDGGVSSNGTPFLLQVIPALSRACSQLFPVMPLFLRSTRTMWLAVPPETMFIPLSISVFYKILAFFTTFWV